MNEKTIILDINEADIDLPAVEYAAGIIRAGGIVVFPTETVYGIGADVFNENAVKKIFKAKGRPADNPLIIHISDMGMVDLTTMSPPVYFYELAAKFWPGPLTMIVKKNPRIPSVVTAGLDTAAIRMPLSNIARMLIRLSEVPIGAPSANISGKPSATSFEHVYDDFYGRVDAIIKSGDTKMGLESTVIDLTLKEPEILRPGYITSAQISEYLGFEIKTTAALGQAHAPRSPGMKYRHYAPNAYVMLFSGEKDDVRRSIIEQAKIQGEDKKVGILSFEAYDGYERFINICLSRAGSLEEASGRLYHALRRFDQLGMDVILCETVAEDGLGEAIMNRLLKAGNNKVKYV